MPSILIHFDEAALRILDRIAPVAKRERAEFILQAVKEAIRRQEFTKIRESYLQQPDTAEADDWSTAEGLAKALCFNFDNLRTIAKQ